MKRTDMRTTAQIRRQAKQLYRLCLINGTMDGDRVRLVVRAVAQSKRRGCLPLLTRLQKLVKLDLARHTANVDSAIPLPADVQADVEAGVKSTYGPGVSAVFGLNPALIGGIRVQVASDVYDGSVRAGLALLERHF
jgi:F-type H+-transporting ATPase subunit delta